MLEEYIGLPINANTATEKNVHPPQGYLLLSDAYARLYAGVWGGFKLLPAPRTLGKYKSSVGFGARQDEVAQLLTDAARDGSLMVYVVADPNSGRSSYRIGWPPAPTKEPVIVPRNVVNRLITQREMLPDHAICSTIKTTHGDSNLYVLLKVGALVVQEREFKRWYRSEKAKGIWPSQRSRSKRRPGRPTKQTEPLRDAVFALVRRQAWSAGDGITKLGKLLTERGGLELVPSADTIGRLITRLYLETCDPALLKVPRIRKKL